MSCGETGEGEGGVLRKTLSQLCSPKKASLSPRGTLESMLPVSRDPHLSGCIPATLSYWLGAVV